MEEKKTILSVNSMSMGFKTDYGDLPIMHDIDFDIYAGETLGVVGEWKLDGDVEKGEEFDATATLEQTLRIRDEQQQRRAEAHNRLEA